MTSDIAQRENLPLNIDRLAAQRQLYSIGKKILAVQTMLNVPCSVAWSLAAIFYPPIGIYAACWGGAATLLDVCFSTPRQKALRQSAARIQELLDCELFQLEWRQLKAGQRPGAEVVKEYSTLYKSRKKDLSDLQNWYPAVVDKLPIHLARLICQRINCWWDARLRRRYAALAIGGAFTLITAMVILGLVMRVSFDLFLVGIVIPMLPILVMGIRDSKEHGEVSAQLERVQEHVDNTWRKALDGSDPVTLTKDCRDIQDEIFDLRQNSPMIFNWIHDRLRNSHETLMEACAEERVEEALTITQVQFKPK